MEKPLSENVFVQTNKESEDGFPAYVVHYTDYSPNRKILDVEVRPLREENGKAGPYPLEESVGGWSAVKRRFCR